MALAGQRRGVDLGLDGGFGRLRFVAGHCLRLGENPRPRLAQASGGGVCGVDSQHPLHRATVFYFFWFAHGGRSPIGRMGFGHCHGGQPGRLFG